MSPDAKALEMWGFFICPRWAQNGDSTEMAETTNEAAAVTATGTEATEAAKAQQTEAVKTPEQLKEELASAQARIHELNKENEGKRKKLDAIEAEKSAAEEERLAKQGEFETLANTHKATAEAKTAELEAAQGKIAKYEELLGGDIDKRIENWPDKIKALVPKEGSALERLQEVSRLEPLAVEWMGKPTTRGLQPGPVASNGNRASEPPPPPPGYRL